ncbi:MAG: DNA polymerase IV, partial [Petrotogales bacterium]
MSTNSQLELRGISTFSNIKNLTNSGIITKASTGKTQKSISYIAHIDMDAFFASVEQAANPYLKGKPIIVTGKDTRHSVVTSASYEAKKHGIKAGMPAFKALKLCHDAISVPVDGGKYTYVSEEIMKRLEFISPKYSVASIDEAFIDLSVYNTLNHSLKALKFFRNAIEKDFGISFSIGVAVNPLIAKIASDFKKPRGFVVIENEAEKDFLKNID